MKERKKGLKKQGITARKEEENFTQIYPEFAYQLIIYLRTCQYKRKTNKDKKYSEGKEREIKEARNDEKGDGKLYVKIPTTHETNSSFIYTHQ